MIQFILDNKEWLFSGIGVFVLTIIIYILKKVLLPKYKQANIERAQEIVIHKSSSNQGEAVDQNNSIERISDITISDITETIEKAPPLQRDDVKRHFEGIKVEWDCYLKGASKDNEVIVTIRLAPGLEMRDSLNTITCKVSLDNYRELGILPEGSRIRIQGEIARVDSFYVELINVRLYFSKNS